MFRVENSHSSFFRENVALDLTILQLKPLINKMLIQSDWKFDPNQANGSELYQAKYPSLPLIEAVHSSKTKMVEALTQSEANPYLTPANNPKWKEHAAKDWVPDTHSAFDACNELHSDQQPAIKKLLVQYQQDKVKRSLEIQ